MKFNVAKKMLLERAKKLGCSVKVELDERPYVTFHLREKYVSNGIHEVYIFDNGKLTIDGEEVTEF